MLLNTMMVRTAYKDCTLLALHLVATRHLEVVTNIQVVYSCDGVISMEFRLNRVACQCGYQHRMSGCDQM